MDNTKIGKVAKTYADCDLYNEYPQYNKDIFSAIMSKNFIDKGVDKFKDVEYEVKRSKISYNLTRVLMSNNTVLVLPDKPMPKPFKVFCAKDVRDGKKLKVFIDCTGAIFDDKKSATYRVADVLLISYLINAYNCMSYAVRGIRAFSGNTIEKMAECFAQLFTHVVDYVGKISVTDNAKDKCLYLSARYFLEGVLWVNELRARDIARKIAGITETREIAYNISAEDDKNGFGHIKNFVNLVREQFNLPELTANLVVEKWMYLYGPGTVMALEFAPAMCAMITDAYCGAYINNQKTIEKICGKSMVILAKSLIV